VVFIICFGRHILVNKWYFKEKVVTDNTDLDPLIPATGKPRIDAATKRGRIQMILLLLICASPVIASYFTFYVIKPQGGKTNIGELVTPVQSMPTDTLDISLQGKWTVLVARPAANCQVGNDECVSILYLMRQARVAMGKESQRIQLVWLVTDQAPIDPNIAKAYDKEAAGFSIIRMPQDKTKADKLNKWLNLDQAGSAIHLLDPRSDRMMRFDTTEGAPDFKKFSKDLEKLLKWNAIGKAN
jgi:hypothetical protein